MIKKKLRKKNNIIKYLCLCLCGLVLVAFCSVTFFNFKNVSASTNNFIPMSFLSNSVIYSYSRDGLGNNKNVSCSLDNFYYNNQYIYDDIICDTSTTFNDETGEFTTHLEKIYLDSRLVNVNSSTMRYSVSIYDSSSVSLDLSNVVVFSFYDDVTENLNLFLNRLNFSCNNDYILSFNISYRDNLLNQYNYNYSDSVIGSLSSYTPFGDFVINNSDSFDISPFYLNYKFNNSTYEFYIIDSIKINLTPISNLYSEFNIYESIKQVAGTSGEFLSFNDYNNIVLNYNSAINSIYYNNGVSDGNNITNFSPFRVIVDTVESFLQFEPFKGFKIYYFFVIGLGGTLIMFFIKWALGG